MLSFLYGLSTQGGVTGPKLFIICINYLIQNDEDSILVVFEDDTTFFFFHNQCPKKVIARAIRSLCNIKTRRSETHLTLNKQKSQCIVFHHKKRRRLTFDNVLVDNEAVVRVPSYR